jgi:hypothetical protein
VAKVAGSDFVGGFPVDRYAAAVDGLVDVRFVAGDSGGGSLATDGNGFASHCTVSLHHDSAELEALLDGEGGRARTSKFSRGHAQRGGASLLDEPSYSSYVVSLLLLLLF